ncbi:probable peptide/nitrate transporter At3g43790 isoform X2 [Diospyros lotus]|uniref:probable peptide/nitrate transporter At3g43790 isoform X2 n=1 Tax=Diospyros lotus TaxID=55363 RepID=UPI00224D2229|nr:probable peptide/nitrate transporter At3g43790 isoform X2 [Diospyros lotus]
MDENSSTSLLLGKNEKVHFHDCPGCQTDRLKQTNTGIPYKFLSYIWLVSLCTALPTSSLYPFVYFMIRDFHIAIREEDIGYYAGILGSSFMVGRALTSVLWGILADRYGRKPIVLVGTLSVFIFNTLFGLSTNFWMALSMRFLLGCFNSLLGTIRAYASEICREEHQALALSVVSTSRGIGLIIGPAIGGFFAQPVEKYPDIFSGISLFGRFPYLLPCLIISLYSMGVFISCWWLPFCSEFCTHGNFMDETYPWRHTTETLHIHKKKAEESCGTCHVLEDSSNSVDKRGDIVEAREIKSSYYGSLLKNWPLMSTIIVYCVFSLQEVAYSEIFSLWAVSDKKYGGLSFSSQEVGEVLAISGFGLLLFQLLLYPSIEKMLGPLVVTRLSAVISIPLLSIYPYIAMLSGLILHMAINLASILRNTLSVSLVTGIFILLNNAVPQHQRGAANGISMAAMSVSKAFGPAGGGALFSLAQKRQVAAFLPGDQLVFFVLNLIQFIGLVLTFKPFLARP